MVSENAVDLKKSQRNFYLEEIKKISASDKALKSTLILNNLRQMMQPHSGLWAGFKAFQSEPNLLWSAISSNIDWCFPVMKDGAMFFENDEKKKIELKQIQGFIVPGLSFDRQGVRLGRGGGHYDRALANQNAKKIGVCFNITFCQELPVEKHDVRFSTIVTDQQVFEVI